MLWLRRIEPLARPFVQRAFRLLRGGTLGVRGLAVDADGRVLLVEHTYVPGWHLPGGGVEPGETAEAAIRREMMEEAGVEITSRPQLLSIHSNHRHFRRDQVLLYRCPAWRPCAPKRQGEIHAVGWFVPDALPPETTPATRARIREALDGADPDPLW